MTQTVPSMESSRRSQIISGAQAAQSTTQAKRSARLDVILNATQIYSDARGAKRSHASDPLFGLEPDANASAPGNPPLTSNRAYTLFDAIKSIGVLFNAEAAISEGSMNMMQTVSGALMHQLKQQQGYQNDIASLNKSLKADQPPLVEQIFEDIFMVGLGSVLAFTFGGPAAGIAALVTGGLLDFMSNAKLFGTGDNKKSIFQDLLGKLPEGEQIAAKLGFAALFAVIVGAGAGFAVSGVADSAVDGIDDAVEMEQIGGDAEEDIEAQTGKRLLDDRGKRFWALTISNLFTNGSKIDSALNDKLKDGQPDKTQLGLWGDIFKSMGMSDLHAGIASGIFVLAGTITTMGIAGYTIGTVPTLETGMMERLMSAFNAVLAMGTGATSFYQGVMGFKLTGVLDTQADVVFQLDGLQKQLQSTEFMQHLTEQLNNRATSLSTSSMNTVQAVLGDFKAAVGLNQAV